MKLNQLEIKAISSNILNEITKEKNEEKNKLFEIKLKEFKEKNKKILKEFEDKINQIKELNNLRDETFNKIDIAKKELREINQTLSGNWSSNIPNNFDKYIENLVTNDLQLPIIPSLEEITHHVVVSNLDGNVEIENMMKLIKSMYK